jgi:hypothetical protein
MTTLRAAGVAGHAVIAKAFTARDDLLDAA